MSSLPMPAPPLPLTSALPGAGFSAIAPTAGVTSPLTPSELREKLRQLSLSKSSAAVAGETAWEQATAAAAPEAASEPQQIAGETASQPKLPSEAASAAAATLDTVLDDRHRKLATRCIMIVDDEETNILTVQAYLQQSGYQKFRSTTDSREALPIIRQEKPDVVLLDINMPHVNGLEILRCLTADPATRHLPVLVLTAASDPAVKKRALDLGAADFLTKPVDPHDLMPRVRNALLIKSHMDDIAGENARLDALVRRRTEDLSRSRQQLIMSLAKAAEHRDNDTGNHVLRVGCYAGIIARGLGWPEPRVQMIEMAAQLHDVGKIGIPDSILHKPGKLEPEEWELMRKHCSFGKDIIEPISAQDLSKLRAHTRLGADILNVRSSPMMMMAARIAQTHHERWDGAGYPLGLAGEDIPIEGRITAVADVFDALSTERCYKAAYPRQKCFEILRESSGSHFDPQVVDAFFAFAEEIVEVQLSLMDRQNR